MSFGLRNKSRIVSALAIIAIVAGMVSVMAGCTAKESASQYALHDPLVRFKIATTTSLYDTGLWYHLEPIFEELANVEMDIIYAGTGIALEYGRRGDVDAIIVHDRAREDQFIADGYGINRRNLAYNFFLIAGPSHDPISASRIEELIAAIIKREAVTVIMASHDMSQGQRLADRISVLVNGEILQTGGSRDIFASPRNREVAEFVGMENILDGVVVSDEGEVTAIDINGTILEAVADCTTGEEVSVCIRPEDVTLALSKISSSARNSLTGKVSWVVSTGRLSRVEIDCGFPLVVLVTKKSAEELGLKKGKPLHATFKATSIHVIKRH